MTGLLTAGGAGEDYAESLLDLLPGRQMGFTPAVVSSEKGLAAVLLVMVMVTAIAFAQTRQVEVEEESEFSVTLANGVKVELVGVCEHPSDDKRWWGPDGHPLENNPDTQKAKYDDTVVFDEKTESKIEIVYKCLWPESEIRREQSWEIKIGKKSCRVLSFDDLSRAC